MNTDFENKLNKCITESETETAVLFEKMGLECADLSLEFTDDKNQKIGEIDGIFIDFDNEIIIIYDDSTQTNDVNTKIIKWFTKWTCKENEDKIFESLDIPNFPVHILYIDKSKNSSDSNINSIKHIIKQNTSILYKDDFEYFKELNSKIGLWAKNDLYNYINISPPLSRVEIDVQQIYIGDYPAYVFADRPDKILKYSYVSRKRNNDEGYQRAVDYKRVAEMSKKLEEKELNGFPNSILLNSTVQLIQNPIPKSHCPKTIKLSIPNHYASCRIVDGQHRLLSFSNLNFNTKTKFNLPIVLIDNMPIDEEIKLFLEINDTSKSVDPNLRYELLAKITYDKNDKNFNLKKAVELTYKLEKRKPLKDMIFRGEVGDTKKGSITLRTIVDSVIGYKLFDFKVKKLDSIIQSYLTEISINNKNKDYYLSNRGIDLVLASIANELGLITKQPMYDGLDIKEIDKEKIKIFIKKVDENIEKLKSFQGGQGFKNATTLII